MKKGCLEVRYDIASVSKEQRQAMEKDLVTTLGKYGFECYAIGASCVDFERDLLFVSNVKETKHADNKAEVIANPPEVKKPKVAKAVTPKKG